MHKVLCIGGKCKDCGGHVELKVSSSLDTFRFGFVHYVLGFVSGVLGTWLYHL